MIDLCALKADFIKVASLSGRHIESFDITVCRQENGGQTTGLPAGMMAIYIFVYGNEVLKIGIAGPNSNPRFKSHHYNPRRAKSTLAASLIADPNICCEASEDSIKDWIESNTKRINIFIPISLGIDILRLFESFLHCRLRPRYEGFRSQH